MFRIRKELMDAYRDEAIRDFEQRVVEHIERCFPNLLRMRGDRDVRYLIRRGIERAASHGIVAERDVCKFIDLMLVFGADFDEQRPWARDILAWRRFASTAARVNALLERGRLGA